MAGVEEERCYCIKRMRREEEGGADTFGREDRDTFGRLLSHAASARGAGHMAAAPSQDRELSAVAL